jgi:hypothetical protein
MNDLNFFRNNFLLQRSRKKEQTECNGIRRKEINTRLEIKFKNTRKKSKKLRVGFFKTQKMMNLIHYEK